jgi:hypothetical protein
MGREEEGRLGLGLIDSQASVVRASKQCDLSGCAGVTTKVWKNLDLYESLLSTTLTRDDLSKGDFLLVHSVEVTVTRSLSQNCNFSITV